MLNTIAGKEVRYIFFSTVRIIPLTVVVYRVLMVCHVEFCYHRGEKSIRDALFRSDLLMNVLKSSVNPILSLFDTDVLAGVDK